MNSADAAVVRAIHDRYRAVYGTNLQGCCMLIADEIMAAIGGDPVAGRLARGLRS